MEKLHNQAIKYLNEHLSDKSRVAFKEDFFNFYDDTCGQRGHKIEKYKGYATKPMYGLYRVIRKLSFTNEVDKGKEGAILGILDLTKTKFISLHEDKIVFDNVTIYLK